MNTSHWLHILSFFVLVCFSHGQERTDWDREFLHKGVKTLRIRGYHVKKNGAVAQKGALLAEMNIEKTFDAQGNLVREVFFDERNAETLRYEYTYSKQKVKKYKLHLDPKREKVGLTVFNCDGSGNVTKEETITFWDKYFARKRIALSGGNSPQPPLCRSSKPVIYITKWT